MPDAAHLATDKIIEQLARRLNRLYNRANWELTAKVDSFFAKFKKADAKKRALVDAGKLTEKEYKKWRKGQMMMGKHYKELQKQTADIMLHADREAARYINGELPPVVALNYNQVGKDCESAVKGYSFELVDENTVQNLIENHKTLLPYKEVDGKKVVRWNTRRVNAEILQGIIQGESIPKIAKRLVDNVTGMELESAIRNARTAITGAENAGRMIGMQQAQEDGVIMKKEWIATHDSRTRKAHAELNGVQEDIDKPFRNSVGYIDFPGDPHAAPANVYNCFVGETNIATDSEIIRSYKHEYQGKLVTIKTSGGVQFTCTPNHPILTLRGWVSAETLQEGDNLAVAFGQKDNMLRINPDINHAFPRIDAIHNFFDKAGGERTCSLSVNFHGDIPASNVEIITKKGLLWRDGYSGVFNGRNKFLLEHSNKSFMGKRTFVKHFSRIWHTTLGRIGRACKSLSLILIGLRHSKVHGLRPVALLDSGRVKPLQNDTSGYTEILSECLHGFSGVVFSDNIISVDFSSERSHVYNLQTENGYYFVNSSISQNAQKCNGIFAIAHNCRCSLGTVVVGFRKKEQKETREQEIVSTKIEKEERKEPEFIPAKTIQEAEEYAKQFIGLNGAISYKGIDVDYANACNKTLKKIHDMYDVGGLHSISPMNMRSKIFKDSTSEAAYRWGAGDLYINPKYYKSEKSFMDHKSEIDGLMKTILDGGQTLIDSGRATGRKKDYIEALLRTGRQCVTQSYDFVQGTFVHECGHMLDDKLFRRKIYESLGGTNITGASLLAESAAKYGGGISGYAIQNSQEYVAESFTAWFFGEGDKCDPVLVRVFEGAMKK